MEYNELLEEFKAWVVDDSKCQALWNKIERNTASYKDAQYYSERVANWWSDRLVKEYGDADYSAVITDISKSVQKAYSESAYYSKSLQANINSNKKIGMKVLEPRLDPDRLDSFLTKLQTEDAKFLLERNAMQSVARAGVTDTIEANARIQSEAGLYAYIERDTGSGCCAWCESMAGRYIYGQQPNDFFQVHKDCTCTITYEPSKQKMQRISYGTSNGKMSKRTEYL